MALYAVDQDDLIFAADALPGKTYWCADCFQPVRRRRSRSWTPHFYHLQTSARCRLYSKTQDHMLAQVQVQKLFPDGAVQLEKPFIQIDRVADACLESEKLIFEIQCSPMTEKEAERRIIDYRSLGYEVIWLLDDKRYNRKVASPVELFLRTTSAYYLRIRQGLTSDVYDQFEVFSGKFRAKKSRQFPVQLQSIYSLSKATFPPELFPKQVIELSCQRYAHGSRLFWALKNDRIYMHYWRALEEQIGKENPNWGIWKRWMKTNLLEPYERYLLKLIKQLN